MKVVGFERLSPTLDEEIGSAWVIPPRHSAEDLTEYKDLINKAEFNPPTFDDGETTEDQVRRKTAPRKKAVYDDDEDDIDDMLDDGDESLFPANLRMSKPVGPGHDKPVKKRRLRRKTDNGSGDDDLPSEEEDEIRVEKARKRRKRDLDKQRKIKSALYVNPSDDESDAEADAIFFAREEAIRQRVNQALANVPTDVSQILDTEAPAMAIEETMRRLMADSDDGNGNSDEVSSRASLKSSTRRRKRKSDALIEPDDDHDEEEELGSSPPAKKRASKAKKTRGGFLADSSDEDDNMDDAEPSSPAHDSVDEEEDDVGSDGDKMDMDDIPLSPNPHNLDKNELTANKRRPLEEKEANTVAAPNDTDEEEDNVLVSSKRRPRVKSGFVLDSSDEE